jgi:hypothetical protein
VPQHYHNPLDPQPNRYAHILHQNPKPLFCGAKRRKIGVLGSGFGKVQDVSMGMP